LNGAHNCATEDAVFHSCPASVVPALLQLAIERKGMDSVESTIQVFSNNTLNVNACRQGFNESMRPILSKAANKKAWFKDIEPAEKLARLIIMPNYDHFGSVLTQPINGLFTWARPVGENDVC